MTAEPAPNRAGFLFNSGQPVSGVTQPGETKMLEILGILFGAYLTGEFIGGVLTADNPNGERHD